MDEDRFNMELRKFLKVVGVTSQREIENAVHAAIVSGALKTNGKISATMTLRIPEIGLDHVIDGSIEF
ncbi:MAG: DUF6494 family protein [Stellaceae bacterium]